MLEHSSRRRRKRPYNRRGAGDAGLAPVTEPEPKNEETGLGGMDMDTESSAGRAGSERPSCMSTTRSVSSSSTLCSPTYSAVPHATASTSGSSETGGAFSGSPGMSLVQSPCSAFALPLPTGAALNLLGPLNEEPGKGFWGGGFLADGADAFAGFMEASFGDVEGFLEGEGEGEGEGEWGRRGHEDGLFRGPHFLTHSLTQSQQLEFQFPGGALAAGHPGELAQQGAACPADLPVPPLLTSLREGPAAGAAAAAAARARAELLKGGRGDGGEGTGRRPSTPTRCSCRGRRSWAPGGPADAGRGGAGPPAPSRPPPPTSRAPGAPAAARGAAGSGGAPRAPRRRPRGPPLQHPRWEQLVLDPPLLVDGGEGPGEGPRGGHSPAGPSGTASSPSSGSPHSTPSPSAQAACPARPAARAGPAPAAPDAPPAGRRRPLRHPADAPRLGRRHAASGRARAGAGVPSRALLPGPGPPQAPQGSPSTSSPSRTRRPAGPPPQASPARSRPRPRPAFEGACPGAPSMPFPSLPSRALRPLPAPSGAPGATAQPPRPARRGLRALPGGAAPRPAPTDASALLANAVQGALLPQPPPGAPAGPLPAPPAAVMPSRGSRPGRSALAALPRPAARRCGRPDRPQVARLVALSSSGLLPLPSTRPAPPRAAPAGPGSGPRALPTAMPPPPAPPPVVALAPAPSCPLPLQRAPPVTFAPYPSREPVARAGRPAPGPRRRRSAPRPRALPSSPFLPAPSAALRERPPTRSSNP
eukprot:tig00000663_g2958.t1